MNKNMSNLIVTPSELSLSGGNFLSEKQLSFLLKKTPEKYVRKRPAKGGGTWDYVSGGYVKKVLNLMFGWDWDFEILEQLIMHNEAIVKGRLTCRSNGMTIVKTQFGNKDIIYKKGTEVPLSIGNDLKSASTDCLKKCASELGISADIYNKEEFQAIEVISEVDIYEQILELWNLKKEVVPTDQYDNWEKVVIKKIVTSYPKILKYLKSL